MSFKQHLFIIICGLLILTGCGPNFYLNQARKKEEKKLYPQALKIYERLINRYNNRPEIITRALWRTGKIHQKLKNYSVAVEYFQLLKNYSDWKPIAEKEIFCSPDYFPLAEGNQWIEGDSLSAGKNMQAIWRCRKVSPEVYEISRTISAGTTRVSVIKSYYHLEGEKLLEANQSDLKNSSVFLDYPFTPGKSWEISRSGQKLRLTIISNQETVKTIAGQFNQCLKIAEQISDSSGITYRYYAPAVGWVLTTVGQKGSEKEYRNSELLSYQVKLED